MAQTTEFSLRAHLFGTTPGTLGADSRVFRVDMLVPVDKSNLNASMMAIIRQITDDLKHSCPMGCEFCGKCLVRLPFFLDPYLRLKRNPLEKVYWESALGPICRREASLGKVQ